MQTSTAIARADELRARRYPNMKRSVGEMPAIRSWKDLKIGWIWATDVGNAAELVSFEVDDPSNLTDTCVIHAKWKCRCGKERCSYTHMETDFYLRYLDPLRGETYFMFWETLDLKMYPHKCPRCTKPAYVGGGPANIDCSNDECVTKKLGKVA